jgi:hypothetical protein
MTRGTIAGVVVVAVAALAAVPSARADEAMDAAVRKYLESEEGRKALDRSLVDLGFVKTGIGSLKIGGLVDVWFQSQRNDETPTGARTGADTFRLRRAEINFNGTIVKDTIDYTVMIDPARPLGNNEATAPTRNLLQDLKIMYRGPFGTPKDVVVTVGQFKIPFGREGFSQPTWKIDFINRSDGAVTLADARRPGAMVQGAPLDGAVEWFANVHNNSGQNSQDTGRDQKNLLGRLVVNPFKFGGAEGLGDLSLGGTWQHGWEPAGRTEFRRYGADAEWRRGGIFLRTEWFRADHDDTLAADKRSHNFAGGFKVVDDLEVVARHDLFRDQAGGTERVTDTFGLNWFLKGHNAKIDLNYLRIRQTTAASGRTLTGQWILQFQVAF